MEKREVDTAGGYLSIDFRVPLLLSLFHSFFLSPFFLFSFFFFQRIYVIVAVDDEFINERGLTEQHASRLVFAPFCVRVIREEDVIRSVGDE